MIDTFLVGEKTVVHSKGDGAAVDITGSVGRIFLLTLDVTRIIEQESLEVGIYGSSDGTAWGVKPMVAFPQKFYCGDSPLLLDLTSHSEVKFIRAHWEVARWGRGTETPMFEFSVRMKEIPAEMLREVGSGGKVSA